MPSVPALPGGHLGDTGHGDNASRPRAGQAAVSPRCHPLWGLSPSHLGAAARGLAGFHGDRLIFFFFFPIPVFSCAFPSLGARGEVRGFGDAPRGHPATFGHLWAWRLLPAALGADFGISADFCRCRNAMPGRWPVPRLGWGQLGTTGGCVPHPSRGSRAVWDALPSDFDPFPASPRQINSSGSGCSRPGVTSCPTRPG